MLFNIYIIKIFYFIQSGWSLMLSWSIATSVHAEFLMTEEKYYHDMQLHCNVTLAVICS